MSDKNHKHATIRNESEAFEIIELASDDLNALARAFNLISEVCREQQRSTVIIEEDGLDFLVN